MHGWGWWIELGWLEEDLTEVLVGVVWLVVYGEEDQTAGTYSSLGLFLLTPSPTDLFIYLSFTRFAEGREPAGLE